VGEQMVADYAEKLTQICRIYQRPERVGDAIARPLSTTYAIS